MKNYTAKTLEELLKIAAEEKGCAAEDLTYFVTDEKKGLLGLGSSVSADVYCMNDVKEFLFDYIGNYFTSIGHDIEVGIEEKDGGFVVSLNSENNAVLIGKMGKTLAAINTVVRGAVNAQFRRKINVLVDINHYKEERYTKLESMAKRIGRQVQHSKVDAVLDPMPNDERKVIHQILNGWDHLQTESEGEGSQRHVCIRYTDAGSDTEEQPETEVSADETEKPAEEEKQGE